MSNAPTRKQGTDDDAPPIDFATAKRVRRPRKGLARLPLRGAREGLGITQAEMAGLLGTDQGEVSRIERRSNVRYTTLRRYAEALGARCDIAFVFPDGRHLLIDVNADGDPPK
jgi:hypothetical protein